MKTERASFIDRRHFLRGLGMALALPTFDSLNVGLAASTPKTDPRRLICIGNHLGFWPGGFFPTAEGRDYAISKTLAPLQEYKGDFTVFSHLDHGAKGGHGAVHSFLTGVKKEESAGFPEKNISIDQVAAEHVGTATRYPSITAGLGEGTDMCWNRAGVRLPPVTNPARLFEALFVEADAGAKATERERLSNRASVLDALRESAKHLGGTLDAADRSKLDQYLTSVRDVERRLQMSKEWLGKPKPKSPIDVVKDEERLQIEEIPLFMDLMTLALQTDSTRVATFESPARIPHQRPRRRQLSRTVAPQQAGGPAFPVASRGELFNDAVRAPVRQVERSGIDGQHARRDRQRHGQRLKPFES